jgi:hypothetical protein
MNRVFVLMVALFAVLGVTGYAQGIRGFQPAAFPNPSVIAGVVNRDGEIVRGSHFAVHRVSVGKYRIRFDEHDFAGACPALVVTNLSNYVNPPTNEVFERVPCRIYEVYFWEANASATRVDEDFNFIAAGTQ